MSKLSRVTIGDLLLLLCVTALGAGIGGFYLPRYTMHRYCVQQSVPSAPAAPAATPPLIVFADAGEPKQPTKEEIEWYIVKVALEMKVDTKLALEIARQEGMRPHGVRLEQNHTLSFGVYQLNEVTARALGVDDPLDWRQNVIGGVGYLGRLVKKYHGDAARVKCAWVNGEWSKVCQ